MAIHIGILAPQPSSWNIILAFTRYDPYEILAIIITGHVRSGSDMKGMIS